MYPIIIANNQKANELEEELELLRSSAKLDKRYYARLYKLKMQRRKQAKREIYKFWIVMCPILIFAVVFDFIIQDGRFPIISGSQTFAIVFVTFFAWIGFRRKYNSSEEKFSKHLKLQLARQYYAQQNSDL